METNYMHTTFAKTLRQITLLVKVHWKVHWRNGRFRKQVERWLHWEVGLNWVYAKKEVLKMIKIYFFVKNLFQSKFIKWIMNEGKFNFPLYAMLIVVPSCLLVFIYYEEILIKNYFKTIFMLVFVFPFVFHYLFSKIFAINQNLVIFFGFIIVLIYSLLFLFII